MKKKKKKNKKKLTGMKESFERKSKKISISFMTVKWEKKVLRQIVNPLLETQIAIKKKLE